MKLMWSWPSSVAVEQEDTSTFSPIPAFRFYPDVVQSLLLPHIAQDDLKIDSIN
jgi:hypothetical protein